VTAEVQELPKTPSRLLPGGRQRVALVDGLRGLASLAVCWYHLVVGSHGFVVASGISLIVARSAQNAWLGVEVFFVISGFVIPLSLYRAGYRLSNYGTFVLKRIIRLDPPYLLTIGLILALEFISIHVPSFRGSHMHSHYTALTLLLHLGYLNAFFGGHWLSPVFWTLAIEFQYYIGLGVVFELIVHPSPPVRVVVFAALGILAFAFPSVNLVFHYLFLFMLGIVTFYYRAGMLRRASFIAAVPILSVGCWLTVGPLVAYIGGATAVIIAFVRYENRVLGFLGTISYSLYLVHVPIGGRIMNYGLRHAHTTPTRLGVLALGLAGSIAAAYAMYRLVEQPAQRLSSSIPLRRANGVSERVASHELTHGATSGIAEG
jgi:peptidoglycan/LPS O-acetylase OafA/YrhL